MFLFWYWNSILIQPKFYLAATLSKRYPCTQQDVQKIVENSLPNTPLRVKHSEKNCQARRERKLPRRNRSEKRRLKIYIIFKIYCYFFVITDSSLHQRKGILLFLIAGGCGTRKDFKIFEIFALWYHLIMTPNLEDFWKNTTSPINYYPCVYFQFWKKYTFQTERLLKLVPATM